MGIKRMASERARYKLGNLWNQKIEACDSEKTYIVTVNNVKSLKEQKRKPVQWRQDLQQILQMDPTLKIPCVPHDNVCSVAGKYRFCKQRSRGDLNTGMFDSRWLFQQNQQMDYDSVPFAEKKPIVFWRGAATGGCNRWTRERLHEQGHTDDQIQTICAIRRKTVEHFEKNPHKNVDIKFQPRLSQQEYMTKVYSDYKYMIYLEGNDVGSNIWWTYKVNCVTLCPEVLKSECVFDLYTKPWKHYVPIDPFDFNDIIDKVCWCEKNTEKCIDMIEQANHVHAMIRDPELRYETNKIMADKIKSNLII